jgi:TRAP-type uncharacterized transport system fused permease subunit
MRTGFAALKFGATLVLIPLSFVYVPELLLSGTTLEITLASVSYLIGYSALAIAIQKTDFFMGSISRWRQALFLAAAACMLAPLIVWLKVLGVALLAAALLPTLTRKGSRPVNPL